MDIEKQIQDFLMASGVSRFWAYSQTSAISNVLANNKFFVTYLRNPAVVVSEDKFVQEFTAEVVVNWPGGTGRTVCEGKLRYSFDPKATPAHNAKITF